MGSGIIHLVCRFGNVHTMRVTILDDYFDTLRTLPCFGSWRAIRSRSGRSRSGD